MIIANCNCNILMISIYGLLKFYRRLEKEIKRDRDVRFFSFLFSFKRSHLGVAISFFCCLLSFPFVDFVYHNELRMDRLLPSA